jgi:DNA replicative helicase MCM subunit Mcm2 (Cdc46/Mcm family)
MRLDFDLSKFNDAKIVVLQNVDLTLDMDETLEVLLLSKDTENVRAGETVVIKGSIKYGHSNLGRAGKGKKTISLMTAKFLIYEGRKSVEITAADIESFHKFAKLNQGKDVIERLVSMTAPNVIGQNTTYHWLLPKKYLYQKWHFSHYSHMPAKRI